MAALPNVIVMHELVKNFSSDFAVNNNLNIVEHEYQDDLAFQCTTTDTLPGGLSLDTTYYVVNKDNDDFGASLSLGGTPIVITDNGVGTHTFTPHFVIPYGTLEMFVELYGSGGGGAGGNNNSTQGGPGGGAGGITTGYFNVIDRGGEAIPVIIGACGLGGAATMSGTSGNTSSFLTLSATGGTNGEFNIQSNLNNSGLGGIGNGGDINMRGGGGGRCHAIGGIGGSNLRGGGGAGIGTSEPVNPGAKFGGGGSGGGGVFGGAVAGADGGVGGLIIMF